MARQTYAQRIAAGLAKGLTLSQARGHPKKGEQSARVRLAEVKRRKEVKEKGRSIPKAPRYPKQFHIVGDQKLKGGKVRHRDFNVDLSPAQGAEVKRLLDLGKPLTAKTYVLAEVYGSNSTDKFPVDHGMPILAGIEKYQPGYDYDLEEPFPDYDPYDYDLDDNPEPGDGGTDAMIE